MLKEMFGESSDEVWCEIQLDRTCELFASYIFSEPLCEVLA